MRTIQLLSPVCCLIALAGAATIPAHSAPAQPTAPPARPVQTAPIPDFEKLRLTLKSIPVQSLAQLRGNEATLAGRVIELNGQVRGVMSKANVRIFLFKVEDAMATLAVAPDFKDDGSLKQGALVRLLVRVGVRAEGSLTPLFIVAATDKPAPAPIFKPDDTDPDAPVLLSPMTNSGLPEPPPAQPSMIPASRPGLDPDDLDDPRDAQKPAYKALARRFNKKLTNAQAEEIGNALVEAGYSNNIDPRFLAAIIAVESDFDITCLSSSGAMGLGQLMPFNLKEAGITNPWNPTQNIWGTARLLRGHLKDYRGRSNQTLLAVAAYNAGPGAVRRAGYQVPQGHQVQRYVWKVYYRYKEFAPEMFK